MNTTREILNPQDFAARPPDDGKCPGKDGVRCGAPREKRVLSSGFGSPHDVCSVCGYEWDERTL